jgi:hypothetical protein
MDIFRQGRGDNSEFTLRPAIPGLRNIVIGVAVVDKWNGQLPTVESGQGSGMMLQLPKP